MDPTVRARPTPPHQLHLLVVFSAKPLRGKALSEVWLWRRDDAHAWLESRRPLFPRASSQELVSMAILPEDLRDAVAAAFCGQKMPTAQTDSAFCPPPEFATLTSTCAICSVGGILASTKPGRAFDAGSALFEAQINAAIPGMAKMPRGLFNGLPAEDAEAIALAFLDQQELLASTATPHPRAAISKRSANL